MKINAGLVKKISHLERELKSRESHGIQLQKGIVTLEHKYVTLRNC
jgi:hypothetical protein